MERKLMSRVEQAFKIAGEIYAEYGVNVEKALETLDRIPVSIHAWQGDDVKGFESTGHSLTGGCQVTGSYPGCARNSVELRSDLDLAMKLIPGKSRVCLQGHQVDTMFPGVDRDAFTIANFSGWLQTNFIVPLPPIESPAMKLSSFLSEAGNQL